jgi:hypothetical protein
MSVPKKQSVTVALDPPDLELVRELAERERGTPSGVVRRFVAERLHAMRAPAAERAA